MNFVLKPFRNDLRVTRLANIHYFEFTPNYHTDNHPHDFCELVYVDKGNIEVLSDHFKGNLRQNEIHGIFVSL